MLCAVKSVLGVLLGLFAVIALWIAPGGAAFVLAWASDRGTRAVFGTLWMLCGLALGIGYVRWVNRRSAAEEAPLSAEDYRVRRALRKDQRRG
jgi:hypothetical protein